MKKSFLELLEEEKRVVFDMKYFKNSAIDFLNKAETETDPAIKESHKRIASDYEEKAMKAEENLLQIRKEMKQYISFIETL
ncbi:hypothetical protein [Bariatricus sp. SGI.019]|uniref:hypothetical protein n=1 Tax=Bariatricus sp. SGI.019 TaxID=3420548 RepID=UPI003D035A4E